MDISFTNVSAVASWLEQLSNIRQQQVQSTLDAADSLRSARQGAVEQGMQEISAQAERVTEIENATAKARHAGSIDVWA